MKLYYSARHPGQYIVRFADPTRPRFLVPARKGGWDQRTVFHAYGVSDLPEANVDRDAEAARLGIPPDADAHVLDPAIAAIFQAQEGEAK